MTTTFTYILNLAQAAEPPADGIEAVHRLPCKIDLAPIGKGYPLIAGERIPGGLPGESDPVSPCIRVFQAVGEVP